MEENMDTSTEAESPYERQAHLFELALQGSEELKKCSKEELNSFITYSAFLTDVTRMDYIETYVTPGFASTVMDMIRWGALKYSLGHSPGGETKELGVSLLHVAASQGHTELVRFLLDVGCDVRSRTCYHQRTVLHMAIMAQDEPSLELVEMLLEAGVDTTQVDSRLRFTALHLAVHQEYAALLPVLVASGCPLDALSADGLTALYMAVSGRHLDSIRELVRAGASANIATPMGWTPLFLAVRSNRMDIPEILVKGNCDVNVKGYGGTALHHAVYHANLRSVKLLLDNGANPDVASEGGHTPLTVAAYNNSKAIVEALLSHGCHVNQATSHGYMALHLAAWDGHTEIVELLLAKGARQDVPTHDSNTPLALACHGNKLSVIRRLLPHGCDVNNKDKDKDTPLHYVAYNGCMKSLLLLLEAGAEPDTCNSVNATPLWNAVHMKCTQVVYELVRRNVTLNVASMGINQHAQTDHVVLIYTTPRTPFFVALDRGMFDVARVLLLAGTDLTAEPWFWRREFPATLEHNATAKEELLSLACSPLSLKHLCRSFVRRACEIRIAAIVKHLEIPGTLKDFLLLKYL